MAGVPFVMVPVLSRTMTSRRADVSKAAALFTKQPLFAATPVATITAIGVARPIAQGHAIIRTAMPNFMAKSSFRESCTSAAAPWCIPWCGWPPMWPCMLWPSAGTCTAPANTSMPQTAKVMKESPTTEGTNTCATLSAVRCTSALLACASWTSWTICPSIVSQPTFVTRMRQPLETHVEPPKTMSPCDLLMGRLSPVSRLSSTCASPSEHTVPSTGTFAPGKTRSTSPSSMSSSGMSASPLASQRTAVAGMLEGRSIIAFMAMIFARDSRNLPRSTTPMRMGPMVKKWLVASARSCEPDVSGMRRQYRIRPAE